MRFKVDIIESEAGWGQRTDDTIYFDSKNYDGDADKALAAAEAYVQKYNAQNNQAKVPAWYMYATEPTMERT